MRTCVSTKFQFVAVTGFQLFDKLNDGFLIKRLAKKVVYFPYAIAINDNQFVIGNVTGCKCVGVRYVIAYGTSRCITQ